MKKRIIIIVSVIVMIAIAGFLKVKLTKYDQVHVSVDMTSLADGTYTGAHNTNLVKAQVEVTIKDHRITNIDILKHECGLGKKAEAITEDIIQQQSLEVDSVSGATMSSNVIKLAIEEALQ